MNKNFLQEEVGRDVNLGRFPFVRTDRPAYYHRNEDFTFNQN